MFTVAATLTGILGIAAFLIYLGERDSASFPSAVSYQPSGAAALRALLLDNGFSVVVDRSQSPDLRPDDVAVVFDIKHSIQSTLAEQDSETAQQEEQLARELAAFVQKGGTVVSMPVAEDFFAASKATMNKRVDVFRSDEERASVTWSGYGESGLIAGEPEATYDLWTGEAPFVQLRSIGKGAEVVVADGIVATNRFIDQAENAKVVLDAVTSKAAPRSRIVFVEAAIGNAHQMSLMDIIGPWAKAAWMQLLFLGLVIVYTLGKPFGMPAPERRPQRGTRELLDAMAATLTRGKMVRVALSSARDEAQRLITRRFGSGTGATRSGKMPEQVEELRKALALVDSALEMKPPEDQSVKLVSNLDRSIRAIENQRRNPGATR